MLYSALLGNPVDHSVSTTLFKIFAEKRKINKKLLKEPFALDWLFSDYLDFLIKLESGSNKIMNFGICENACATSDAYKIVPFLIDEVNFDNKKQLKIINTGTIGKYFSKWGKHKMTYLGRKYLNPVIIKEGFFSSFKNSYSKKSIQPKIILKGLNLLDACLDVGGNIIPGKSTLIITSKKIENLKFLLAIINCKLVYFYIKEKYIASSYNQGIGFTKEMINNFPLPKITESDQESFINLVDQILKKKKENPQADTGELEREIDEMVYRLYGLGEEEIKIVENSNKK
jgi:hypothetical protein